MKKYNLIEAAAESDMSIFELVKSLKEKKLGYSEKGGEILFSEEDVLNLKERLEKEEEVRDYYPFYGAAGRLKKRIEKKHSLGYGLSFWQNQLKQDSREEGLEIIEIGSKKYFSKKTLDRLVKKHLKAIRQEEKLLKEYYSLEQAREYCQADKAIVTKYSQGIYSLDQVLERIFQKRGNLRLTYLKQKAVKKEELGRKMDFLKNHYSFEEAAHLLRNRIIQIGLAPKLPTDYLLRRKIYGWREQGKIETEKHYDPVSGREIWFTEAESLNKIINDYVQRMAQGKSTLKRPPRKDYKTALSLANRLRNEVARHFHVKLPKKIFMSKPQGAYASIECNQEDSYETNLRAFA